MIRILCKFHVFFIAALIETSDLAKSVIAKSVTAKGKCIWHLKMNLSLKQIQKKTRSLRFQFIDILESVFFDVVTLKK